MLTLASETCRLEQESAVELGRPSEAERETRNQSGSWQRPPGTCELPGEPRGMGQGQALVFGESVKSRIVRKSVGARDGVGPSTGPRWEAIRERTRRWGGGKPLPDSLEQAPLLAASCIGEGQA